MKIIFAPDSFKGSLSAETICHLLEQEAKKVFPNCETLSLPVSDGGEGAVEVVIPHVKGIIHHLEVHGPLGKKVSAKYGRFHNDCMLIEMASASGLTLVRPEERDILHANTFGTGELIRHGLDTGCRHFYIAIGGSATNDGGIGCAAALGVRFFDETNQELPPYPINLEQIRHIDTSMVHPALKDASFTVMCDVQNPLTGPKGATAVFGLQKGGSPDELSFLENGMCHYRNLLKDFSHKDIGAVPGSGAAGGLGVGLLAFTNAHLQSGIETILKILDFERLLPDADLVITGEGQMDYQSAFGKVPCGVGKLCQKHHVPCIAIVGSLGTGAKEMENYGITSSLSIIPAPMSLDFAMQNADTLFSDAARQMFLMIRVGLQLSEQACLRRRPES